MADFFAKNSLQEAQKNRPADNWTAFPKGEHMSLRRMRYVKIYFLF